MHALGKIARIAVVPTDTRRDTLRANFFQDSPDLYATRGQAMLDPIMVEDISKVVELRCHLCIGGINRLRVLNIYRRLQRERSTQKSAIAHKDTPASHRGRKPFMRIDDKRVGAAEIAIEMRQLWI